MTPLLIEFELVQPMAVPDKPIHFDALLHWAVEHREDGMAIGRKLDIPLDYFTKDESSCPKASQLHFAMSDSSVRFQRMMTRKYELTRWALEKGQVWEGNKNVIPDGTGTQKAFIMFNSFFKPDRVYAFCVGDKDKIEDLLSEIRGIGRMNRNGWGKLKGIQVREVSEAECLWQNRTLPISMKEVATEFHFPAVANCAYPYWNRKNWTEVLEFTETLTSV